MTLIEYAYALRRRWITIVVLAVLGGVAGFLVAHFTPESYRSTGSVLVTSNRGDSTSELTQGSTFVQTTIPSYVVMATSDVVLQPVIDDLGLDTTPTQLSNIVTASSPLGTAIIQVSVVRGDAEQAKRIADAVMDSLATEIPKVSPHSADGKSAVTVTTIQDASLPGSPFQPNTRLSTALGILAGLVIGAVYAAARRLFGDHVSSPRDVAQLTETPVLGQVLESKRSTVLAQSLLQDPLSAEAESVRALAANLNFLRIDGGLRSLVVTSPDQGEGKSSVALGLAVVVAESNKRVLLIDADLRRPSIAKYTGLEDAIGLTGVLLGDVKLVEAIEEWGVPHLSVLPSGPIPPNPTQLLSSEAMQELIRTSEREFDLVIIDSGPVLSVSDSIWLSHASSGAILVARWGHTSRRHFARALSALDGAKSRMLGIVLNRKPRRGASRYEYTAPKPESRAAAKRANDRGDRRTKTPEATPEPAPLADLGATELEAKPET
jgi:polysaccharide biosynthesis transport protein